MTENHEVINTAEVEVASNINKPAAEDVLVIYPIGLMPGMSISSETIRKAAEAEKRYQEKQANKKNKPPKPPKRPNARIGRIALDST